jgi:hypothetical protein
MHRRTELEDAAFTIGTSQRSVLTVLTPITAEISDALRATGV